MRLGSACTMRSTLSAWNFQGCSSMSAVFSKALRMSNVSAYGRRSAKIVIQLALDRLARHYGYAASTKGPTRANVRTWLANDAAFSVDELCYGRQRCIRLSANPLHHRTQAVGALRRKIFAKADMVEQRQGIDI